LSAAALLPLNQLVIGVSVSALLFLMLLGAVGARAGGAPITRGILRVAFWGVAAMAATWAIGRLFGTAVA
jgi:VIT1/CCC1 family predicted Fe2+/Mn2+ transporter